MRGRLATSSRFTSISAAFRSRCAISAGIRETDDPVEQEGVRRARQSATAADLMLWVLDVREIEPDLVTKVSEQAEALQGRVWFLVNKIDLADTDAPKRIESGFSGHPRAQIFPISATTGEGIDKLIDAIGRFAGSYFWDEPVLVTRERHRQMLQLAFSALAGALALDQADGSEGREELIAEQVRMATRALERLTGRVDVEDVLDVIFRDFCIGK